MAEEVEIRIQKLRYSGKNYALTKALDCLSQTMFVLFFSEQLLWRCCQWFCSPPSGEPGAVCQTSPLFFHCPAAVRQTRVQQLRLSHWNLSQPIRTQFFLRLSYSANPSMSISLDWAGALPLSQLFVPFLEAESLTPPWFHISSW